MKVCSIEGCDKTQKARGWCAMHYERWKTHGDPMYVWRPAKIDAAERFWAKVRKTETCWIWTARLYGEGYGRLKIDGRNVPAHRFSWELHNGRKMDADKLADHICQNKACVNPTHIRPASAAENNQNRLGAVRSSSTGVLGVSWRRDTKGTRGGRPYVVIVMHERVNHYGGRFHTLEEAAEAAKALRLRLFTHNETDRRTA